jgi:nucleoid DNA-binding protein
MAKKAAKSAAPKSAAKSTDAKKPMTKNQILAEIGEKTDLTKKQVGDVFDVLAILMKQELGKKGSHIFTLPGLIRLRRAERPARPAREGRNPATGDKIMIKAQPKKTIVRARVLKQLNEMIK